MSQAVTGLRERQHPPVPQAGLEARRKIARRLDILERRTMRLLSLRERCETRSSRLRVVVSFDRVAGRIEIKPL